MNQILLLAFIAFFAGMVGAGVGNSGGTLMVAGLLASGVLRDVKTAVGTVLFSILPPVSLGAIIDYWKAGKVKWRMGIVLMIANIIGATVGGYFVMKYISNRGLELFYAVFLFLLSIYFFRKVILTRGGFLK